MCESPLRVRALPCLLLGFVTAAAVSLVAPSHGLAQTASVRFSQTLSADERAAAGLARLSSDEVAVIDALTRRDTGARGAAASDDAVAATFSQRLTAGERETAGLNKLADTERAALDRYVERFQGGQLARTLLAPPSYLSRSSRVRAAETKKEREIHGSFSLSYGVGSGGYSEKSGSMVLTLEDPAKGYSISVGYTETHTKGGSYYRDPFYYDPLRYDPLRPDLSRSPADPASPRP